MPVTDPRLRIGDTDPDGLTADIRTTDPASDTPGIVVRVAGTLGTAPPSGSATSLKQDEQTALLTTIDGDTSGIAASTSSIDSKATADPATGAKQTTQQTRLDLLALESGGHLASLDSKVTAVNTGAVVVASGHIITDTGSTTVVTGSVTVTNANLDTPLSGIKSGTDKIPASPSQEHATAGSPHAARLTDGTTFYKATIAGDAMGADLRVASAAVGNANPVPVSDASGSLTVDGSVAVTSVAGSVAITNAGLTNIDVALSTRASQTTIATLALESGGNIAASKTDLDTIVARTPVLGQALAAASTPVVLPLTQTSGVIAQDATLTNTTARTGILGANGTTIAANANPLPISDAGGSITVDGSVAVTGTSTISGTVTANIGTTNGLALDATLTGGTQVAIAKGPISAGAAAGSEKPVIVGGVDDSSNVERMNIDTTGAVRLQSGGTPLATAPTRATQIAGVDGVGKLRVPLVDAQARFIAANTDFFGRATNAEPIVIANGFTTGGADGYKWASQTATGGTVTFNATTGEYEIATTTTSGSTAIHIYSQTAIYRAGFPIIAGLNCNLSATSSTNKRIEWGITSGVASSTTSLQTADAMGFYLEGGVFGIFYRSSLNGAYPGNTLNVPQSTWGIDVMNGAGVSGKTFVLATLVNINLFEIVVKEGAWGFQWKLNGFVVHEIRFTDPANVIQGPTLRTPHFRLYVYATNSGASAANTFSYQGGAVLSLGGGLPTEVPFASSRTTAITITLANGIVPIYMVRPATTFGGVTNPRRLVVDSYEIRITAQDATIGLYHGKLSDFTITGGSWVTPSNAPRTAFEENKTATAITIGAGAALIDAGEVDNNSTKEFDVADFFNEVRLSVGITGIGEQEVLVLTASAAAGTNMTARVQSIIGDEIG